MTVITRFAPSPTGMLHIGGARTALFNYLFARHHGGKFLLRIEDTDRKRSTDEAISAILDSMEWLGLDYDGDEIYQFARADRHAEVAKELISKGKAYYDYTPQEEVARLRAEARKNGTRVHYEWRDRDASKAPKDVSPVVRLRAPLTGEITINDLVQGDVTVASDTLDDMILLRSDGTPTYMLSVVVDDHDMEVSHVIRGDDHLTNAFRQWLIYKAMEWDIPYFAHIPLIHGADGKKLSKRHGDLGSDAYKEMGYLPEALNNYLLRLGWGYGDEEIVPRERAIEIFALENVGRGAARFDMDKLNALSGHYIKEHDDAELVRLMIPFIEKHHGLKPDEAAIELLTDAMPMLKIRAKTLIELANESVFLIKPQPIELDKKAQKALNKALPNVLEGLIEAFENIEDFNAENVQKAVHDFGEKNDLKLGQVASPLRAVVNGSMASPPIFEVCAYLGKAATISRIKDGLTATAKAE